MELEKYGTKKPKKNFNKVHNDNDNGRYILVSKDHQVHEENCVSEEIFRRLYKVNKEFLHFWWFLNKYLTKTLRIPPIFIAKNFLDIEVKISPFPMEVVTARYRQPGLCILTTCMFWPSWNRTKKRSKNSSKYLLLKCEKKKIIFLLLIELHWGYHQQTSLFFVLHVSWSRMCRTCYKSG